jgi:hypothetical protein
MFLFTKGCVLASGVGQKRSHLCGGGLVQATGMKAGGLILHFQQHQATPSVQLTYFIIQGALAGLFASVAIVQLVACGVCNGCVQASS